MANSFASIYLDQKITKGRERVVRNMLIDEDRLIGGLINTFATCYPALSRLHAVALFPFWISLISGEPNLDTILETSANQAEHLTRLVNNPRRPIRMHHAERVTGVLC